MSQEILEAKSALKALVDAFSNLADENRIPDQMLLLTPDATVQVYMGDELLVDISGTRRVEEAFTAFTANVKRSFHLNGQHVVEIDGDSATGIAYCQVKHVSEEDGHEVVTDSSVRYDDGYIRQDGRWYISTRIAHFTVNDRRTLQS
jgi:ketosteroid isomerase-like protein